MYEKTKRRKEKVFQTEETVYKKLWGKKEHDRQEEEKIQLFDLNIELRGSRAWYRSYAWPD